MTPEQTQREMQAAGQIRETMKQQGALGRIQAFREYLAGSALGRMYDSDASRYLVGVLREGNRRVFEEGWFGRTTTDIIYGRNMGEWGQQGNRDQPVDQEAEKGQDEERDNIMEQFYGASREAQQEQGPEQSHGMER